MRPEEIVEHNKTVKAAYEAAPTLSFADFIVYLQGRQQDTTFNINNVAVFAESVGTFDQNVVHKSLALWQKDGKIIHQAKQNIESYGIYSIKN